MEKRNVIAEDYTPDLVKQGDADDFERKTVAVFKKAEEQPKVDDPLEQ